MASSFESEYKKLNKAQKEAVDTIDGPVMVVAGPGTGKTQILALRIANILKQTDAGASSILALTFTNSAVEAMQKRLEAYIGEAGKQVNVFTFHSFGMKIIGEYYEELGLKEKPELLEGVYLSVFMDQVLSAHEWEHLRPRSNRSRYFSDLKSLISLLKRERITSEKFFSQVESEIKKVESDPANLSTRGESKGTLKKEALAKIEGLERTLEAAKFFKLYEEAKAKQNVFDYDDILENLVRIVETSRDVLADIREKYLYILVDEHQDSSRVQNEFLKKTWGDVESPNIFAVGDDRQLIYGFSGASIEYFKGFQTSFRDAKLVTLVDNYRSTQVILDASHALLSSVMTKDKLQSQSKAKHPLRLFEGESARDEIIACAVDIKEKIEKGLDINSCAVLMPKNSQVRKAIQIFHELGLKTASEDALNLFDQDEAMTLLRVLKVISNPDDGSSFAFTFFDRYSGVTPLEAHAFLASQKMRDFTFASFTKNSPTLFADDAVSVWVNKLLKWQSFIKVKTLPELIQTVGSELFQEKNGNFVSAKDILDTILALAAKEVEKKPDLTLEELVSFFDRLQSFGEHIPVVSSSADGIKVLTLHSSKGLEFDYVWIVHMNERSLNSGKGLAFALPESVAEKVEERDSDSIKRKLYVAVTRARKHCSISYALKNDQDREQSIATVIRDLPEEIFEKIKIKGRKIEKTKQKSLLSGLKELVAQKYRERYVSVSLLNNFFECSWKWYFRNLLQLPEPETESLIFGSRVHKALEELLNGKDGETDKEIRKILDSWIKNRLPQIEKNRKMEEAIFIRDEAFPHLNFFGKIDLIESLPEGRVRVTDFKTGSAKKKSEIEKIDDDGRLSNMLRQLAMYSYLVRKSIQSPATTVHDTRLEFLEAKNPKDSIYDHLISEEEINLLLQDIKDYDEAIKSGAWMERACNYNAYGSNTECPYCKLSEVYK